MKRLVQIALAADERSMIENQVYEDCEIRGPAMLALVGPHEISNCVFDGTFDSMFFEVDEGRHVLGVIGVRNTAFRRCRFVNVGMMGTQEMIRVFGQDLLRDD
jgi:hypothetical protein